MTLEESGKHLKRIAGERFAAPTSNENGIVWAEIDGDFTAKELRQIADILDRTES